MSDPVLGGWSPAFFSAWLSAFVVTCLVETPYYVGFAMGFRRLAWPRAIVASLALQMMTHPVLWLVWPFVEPDADGQPMSYEALVVLAETLVILVEGTLLGIMWRGAWAQAYLASFVANAVSTLVGILANLR
jgi:hypothetical protein